MSLRLREKDVITMAQNPRGGSNDQRSKTGQQSQKNDSSSSKDGRKSSGTQGGTSDQHAESGRQSHKNEK